MRSADWKLSNQMKTGNLTPKSNNLISGIRFTGSFGQPDGFGSILEANIKKDGRLVLTCTYKIFEEEKQWSVELDNTQRKVLGNLALSYEPVLFEDIVRSE